jgi:UDP-glucose 4-epimerase
MKYIVTGSSGFIGKHVTNFLGDDAIKLTREKNEFKTADIVIHIAASKVNCIENNVTYTKFILDSMIEHSIKKIVYISTIEVYGPSSLIRDENSPTSSSTMYSATKIAGEELCKAYKNLYGIEVLILRLCNVYGPDMDPNKYIMKCINNYEIDLHDGIRSYIHVYDLCNIILWLIKETGIFNVVGEKITNSDILSFTNKPHIVTQCNGNAVRRLITF